MFINEKSPFDPRAADQYFTVLLFQVPGRHVGLEKIHLFSISCWISETLNYAAREIPQLDPPDAEKSTIYRWTLARRH